MSAPSTTLIAPVVIAITSVSANPDLTVNGIDLDNGTPVSVSIKADAFASPISLVPTVTTGLVLVLSLQSVTTL